MPTHITVTLSPETIAALAEALRPTVPRRAVFVGTSANTPASPPFAGKAVDIFDALPGEQGSRRFLTFLSGRDAITIPEVLEALGIAPERRTRGMAMRVGEAMRVHGWTPSGQRSRGQRDRIYRPTVPPSC